MSAVRAGLVVLVSGSREWPARHDYVIHQAIEEAIAGVGEDVVLMHGGCATGADQIADDYWRGLGRVPQVWPADWTTHGRAAGPRRNAAMVAWADEAGAAGAEVIALFFPWGRSPGTRGCYRAARGAGLTTRVLEGSDVMGGPPPSMHPGRWG